TSHISRVERFAIKGRISTPAGLRYEGTDNTNWMPVLIMRIPEPGTPSLLHNEAFQALKTILPSLRHANIAAVVALETDDDGAFAAYARMDGETLLDWLLSHGVMTLVDAAPLALDCLKALDALHLAGILHGDICPSRILVNRDATLTLNAILIEPALAFLVRSYEADIPGTPPPGRDVVFTSPETIKRETLDVRSDLYSLGATLYYCLTGQLPFAGSSPSEIALAHLQGTAKPIENYRDDIPAGVSSWLMSLMARDPDDRPSSASIAHANLQSALATVDAPPVIASPEVLMPPIPQDNILVAQLAPLPPKPNPIPHPSPEYRPIQSSQPTRPPVGVRISLLFIILNSVLAISLTALGIWYFAYYHPSAAPSSVVPKAADNVKAPEYPRGRYVRIENRNMQILNFAECLVFSEGFNIAIKGKSTASSEHPGGAAKNGNDGNTAPSFSENSCVHTIGNEDIAWWEVDLLETHPIELVEVWNRKEADDLESMRLSGFQIVILDSARKEIYRSPPTKAPAQSVKFDLKDVKVNP
ncbi:MAG: protein kinase, partial [Verrucomicrobia bacterium]|nr:protein kinase [Verrucomicrobiota bacterium]